MAKQEKFGVLIEGKETVSSAAKSAESGLGALSRAMFGTITMANLTADAIKAIGSRLYEFIKGGTEAAMTMEGMEAGFKRLADNSTLFLEELKKATAGTVSEFNLIQQANKAMLLGIDQNKLPEMFKGAAIIAQASGEDVTYALEKITLGIGKQSQRLLDDLGIRIKAEEAYKKYAESINVTVQSLTEEQEAIAYTDAAMKALNERMIILGGEILPTTKTKVDELKVSFDKLKETIGEKVTPAVEEGAGWLSNFIDKITLYIEKLDMATWVEKQRQIGIEKQKAGMRALAEETDKYNESLIKSTVALKENATQTQKNIELTRELTDVEHARAIGYTGGLGERYGGAPVAVIVGHKSNGTPVWGAPGSSYSPSSGSSSTEANTQ